MGKGGVNCEGGNGGGQVRGWAWWSTMSSVRFRGDVKIPHRRMTNTCWGNIGDLFVICMRQLTKGHLYHLLGVSDYYVMYRKSAQLTL